MHCSTGLLFLLSSTLLCPLSQITATVYPIDTYCGLRVSHTDGSIYQANLMLLLSSLSFNATDSNGFYNTTMGKNPDMVYGLFLCRGDITSEECDQCIKVAGGGITRFCPNSTFAIIWYDLCMLRYSNQRIFSTLQKVPSYVSWSGNTSNADQFTKSFRDLINGLIEQAAFRSTRMYAAGSSYIINSFEKIYGLLQCTPDLSHDDCSVCLKMGLGKFSKYNISDKNGATFMTPSCTLRYEHYAFYESNPAPSTNANIIIITVILAITAVILLSILYICFRRRRKRKREIDGGEVSDEISMAHSLQFDFDTIRHATAKFSDLNKLVQGGFGFVYKGKLLNGQEVAVKRLSKGSRQGELEFKNEVVLVAKLQHRNLVRLLGFSSKGEEKLLIYEFLPNASLDHFLFDPIKRAQLDWETRYKIIRGIARGLLYLHEDSRLKIIHRDLKASNVLLDEEMNPKISDFGMARHLVVDQTQNTRRIVGTYGYMAPEFALHGFFSVKSDVFSFGVLLLEIVSGRKSYSFCQLEHTEDLLSYAWRHWRADTALELIDTTLRGNCLISKVLRCIHIGLLCVQKKVGDRPTMASVDLMFNSSNIALPTPSSPVFFIYNRNDADRSTSDKEEPIPSTNGASITELYPR